MRFLTLLLFFLSSAVMAGGSAQIDLKTALNEQLLHDVLPVHAAMVASGSYSGLRLVFRGKKRDAGYRELSLFIPSHDDFSVGYDSHRGVYLSRMPAAPFRFFSERTQGIYDRRGRSRSMLLSVSEMEKRSSGSWSESKREFSDCVIEVESMFIRNGALTLNGALTCKAETGVRAVGAITLDAVGLGVSKVD